MKLLSEESERKLMLMPKAKREKLLRIAAKRVAEILTSRDNPKKK